MRPAAKAPYRIQVWIDTELEYFREAMLGIRRYGFESGRLHFADRWLPHEFQDLASVARRDRIDGIVAALHSPQMESVALSAGLPVVNISNSISTPRTPVVSQDDTAVGKLAAQHLRDCGCRHFAFFGQNGASYSEERWAGFCEALAPTERPDRAGCARPQLNATDYERLCQWLGELKRPAGVFAAIDDLALALQRAARDGGLRVPEDLAILGAGNDDFQVEFEQIPLSSIQLPSRRIGYEAAAQLDRILSGHPSRPFLRLPVGDIAIRRSTDIQYCEDPKVAQAMRLIRQCPGIRVADLAQACGMARSGLQRRFHQSLGRGMLDEIQRVRLARAQSLLRTTDAKLEWVAEQSGYASVQRLHLCFREEYGIAPGAYRSMAAKP